MDRDVQSPNPVEAETVLVSESKSDDSRENREMAAHSRSLLQVGHWGLGCNDVIGTQWGIREWK